MTLSEIRRRIDALKRKFARELAIIKLRRIAEAVADDWDPAEPPPSSSVSSKPAAASPPSSASAAASRTHAAKAKSPTLTIWC